MTFWMLKKLKFIFLGISFFFLFFSFLNVRASSIQGESDTGEVMVEYVPKPVEEVQDADYVLLKNDSFNSSQKSVSRGDLPHTGERCELLGSGAFCLLLLSFLLLIKKQEEQV